MQGYREFTSSADMIAHYAAVKSRIYGGRKAVPREAVQYVESYITSEHFKLAHRYIEAETIATCDDILHAVSEVTGVSVEWIKSPVRKKTIVSARHVAYYLCRCVGFKSYPFIGRIIGKRDHSTVYAGCYHVTMNYDRFKGVIDATCERLGVGVPVVGGGVLK